MIGTATLTLLCISSFCVAFEFDLLGRPQFALFAPNDLNEALLGKVVIEEDNAGFERPQIFGGRSASSTRRLLQEPPLKKRSAVEHKLIRPPPLVKRALKTRLIREPPLKRSFAPIDLVYRFPYSAQKASRFGPVIEPIDF
ncbi:hypothetical protein M3Y97_00883500 [Aphelenchoides bicaudatus]|nr:hypothetical protein M3Y97_00883500 [Aphelenchoides bicaudatus]